MNVPAATIFPLGILLAALVGAPVLAGDCSALTEAEDEAGFELLFDGKDFNGWKQSGNWVSWDGAIFRGERGGGISYSVKPIPDDFELRFEWKVGEKSNSGVYYRPGQYEYQTLDNKRHADGKNPRSDETATHCERHLGSRAGEAEEDRGNAKGQGQKDETGQPEVKHNTNARRPAVAARVPSLGYVL